MSGKQVSVKEFIENAGVLELPTHDLKKEEKKWVEVSYGPMGDDYVWSFSSFHPRKTFPKNLQTLLSIVVTYLSKEIPESVKVDCIVGSPDWEIRPITVIAHGVAGKWNFDESNMTKHLDTICELMSEEIDKANPPKRL